MEYLPRMKNAVLSLCRCLLVEVGVRGKSFWIKGISSCIKQVFKAPVALMAPTGIAASNKNGMTLHRFLGLPVQHGSVPPYAPLLDECLNQTYNLLKDVKLFILDEISMVSNLMLAYIHRRLCEIFGKKNRLMVGVNNVYLGDLLQLAPVKNGPCFKNLQKSELQLLRTVGSFNLWKEVQFEEFFINVRQEHDEKFGNILKDISVENVILCFYNSLRFYNILSIINTHAFRSHMRVS